MSQRGEHKNNIECRNSLNWGAVRIKSKISSIGYVNKVRDNILSIRRNNLSPLYEALKAAAQRSQEFHKEMIIKIEDSKKLRAEANRLHQLFLEAKEKATSIKAEIIQVSNGLRRIKGEIREEEDQKRKQSEESLREKLQAAAKEKLKRGEKLTWDEFKLLNEDQSEESED